MISVSDFRNGVTFDMDGKVMQIIEFQHVKPGKGAAFVRVKMRNVITGGVTETTAMTLPILDFGLGCACRLSGLRSEQASPQLEQLPPQVSLMMQKSPFDRSGVYGADIVMVYYSRCGLRTQVRKPQNS